MSLTSVVDHGGMRWYVTHCESHESHPRNESGTLCAGSRDQFQLQLTHGTLCIGAMQLASRIGLDSREYAEFCYEQVCCKLGKQCDHLASATRFSNPTRYICHFFIAILMKQTDVLVDQLTVQKNIYSSSLHFLHYGEIIKLSVYKN